MEENVLISISGTQSYVDAEADAVELVTPGRLSRRQDGYTLTYRESPLTGLNDTVTTIEVDGPQVTVQRTGEVNTQMVFQAGRRHLSLYDTPYGSMSVGVRTRRISTALSERSGNLEIDYAIEVDHSLQGRNTFRISYQAFEGRPLFSSDIPQ